MKKSKIRVVRRGILILMQWQADKRGGHVPTVVRNQLAGARREVYVLRKLKQYFPNADIQKQKYLRNSKGEIVRSPTGRRLDFVVVENGKVRYSIEVTSKTASKQAQTAKELSVRKAGGIFIRDTKSRKLLQVPTLSRVSRRL